MSSGQSLRLVLISLISISCFSSFFVATSISTGFSARIFHIDSPQSPFYNPNLTRFDRIQAAVVRSLARNQYFNTLLSNKVSPNSINSYTWPIRGGYVMPYFIGTPLVQTYSLIDTGSNLIWLQCSPCNLCYNQSIPLFDPSNSSTFKVLSCADARCPVQRGSGVCGLGDQCQYEESYADGTSTVGDIAEDTFSFKDSNGYFICPVVFGCGHENTDTSSKEKFPGVIGLNREPESLVTQLAIKQFAYCFAFYDVYSTTGYIKFGKAASITGLKTPLLSFKNLDDSSYFIDLEGISISGSRIPIPEGTFSVKGDYNETGGVFIDSGAEFTHLNRTGLNILIDEMVKIVDYVRVDHPHKSFQLCYRTAYLPSQSVTFHFKDADMALPEWNTWIQTDPNTVCLAMLPTDDRSVLGSFQQQNYNVGYDWENNVISFQLNYCDDDLD